MSKITLCFPGGAGGNWLSNLVHCLENQLSAPPYSENYHQFLKSESIELTHFADAENLTFFNGKKLFNIYLNVAYKYRELDKNLSAQPITEQFETLASEASSKLCFLDERTDIDWDKIFTNPDEFILSVYDILDSNEISYTKNNAMCLEAIDNYKKSCIDASVHFDNWDSVLWLGWCNGVSKHLWQEWPGVNSVDELKDFLNPKKEFYKEFTMNYTML